MIKILTILNVLIKKHVMFIYFDFKFLCIKTFSFFDLYLTFSQKY